MFTQSQVLPLGVASPREWAGKEGWVASGR